MTQVNKQVRLAARPSGLPKASDWAITSEPVPAPGPGQFVVAVSHVSLDPAMRGWMNAARSYVAPVELGAVMRAGGIGQVTASEHPGFAVGDDVLGMFGVQDYAVSDGKGVSKLDGSLAPLTAYLGVLGTGKRLFASAGPDLELAETRKGGPDVLLLIYRPAKSAAD